MSTADRDMWDEETDVVVVGFGGAGAAAAIAARQAGAEVLVLEKMPDPGGLTIVSAGGVRIAFDRAAALSYLEATCAGRTPRAPLEALADGMVAAPDWLRELAEPLGATVTVTPSPGNYPFPGYEALGYAAITEVPGLETPPHAASKLTDGGRLFHALEAAARRKGARIVTDAPVRRLLTGPDRAVTGLLAEIDGRTVRVRARRGVVLACGGFETGEALKRDHFQAIPVLAGSFLGNSGDGIAMAQDVGAALWHMWHYHGPYGLRHSDPAYPYAFYLKALPMWTPGPAGHSSALGLPAGTKKEPARVAWILVDQTGRRFMDEYPPYPGDTGIRPLDAFDPKTQSFPRIPARLILDENGRRLYPIGRSIANGRAPVHEWSADNLREIELGILRRADNLAELAAQTGIPESTLADTLARWNAACREGHDHDHGRRPDSMVPIDTPPFYHAEAWPIVINTQGGPVHDPLQRVLTPFGEPIPRLFAAGELGSVFGHLYLSGGNLAECLVGGRIAGQQAAAPIPANPILPASPVPA
ncbi:succinate dehydrogenase/fumarate reductase flavoprotein subunit [Azospirillum agricola]|uniref:FAD-dependent oxidoreductase n=1 Tax=Azospirillum agricola TaxID=1720247 RepID=UPI001AEAD662|nr:FAD-dependent oxidoreductase [Azospirillum agricola]MBP2231865.1 succinate dehydrogenase/fumarate reductase flavoprotein subunit [Azospirillum agricola]